MTKKITQKALFTKPMMAFLCVFFFTINNTQATPKPNLRNLRIGNIKVWLTQKAQRRVRQEVRRIKANPYFKQKQVPLANLYLSLVAQELRPLQIPIAFKYLALANNPEKDSIRFWANAPQMASTLNLRVNAQLDETLNIVMTSQAVALYFRKKHQRNNNWIATLLSYQMSPYQIRRFLRKNYSRKINTLRLDKDIPPFLLKFLATWTAYSPALGKKKRYPVTLIKYDLVNHKTFAHIGKEFSIPSALIQHYNAWFRGKTIPDGRKYYVIIPMPTYSPSRNVSTRKHKKRITHKSPSKPVTLASGVTHKVSRGETLYSISRLYGVSVPAIKKWNHLTSNKLRAGQQLSMTKQAKRSRIRLMAQRVPQRNSTRYAGGTKTRNTISGRKLTRHSPVKRTRKALTHIVKSGDNLYRISKKYKVSVAQIRSLNRMKNDMVFIGKRLVIRPASGKVATSHTSYPRIDKAATSAPNVPQVMYVTGMKLKLTSYARRLIQYEINQLKSHPRFFQKKLQRIQVYMPIIKKILHNKRIPRDFKFLPILESSLIANAVSASNAVGYWQFKEDAALEVGIQIDENVDERLNIVAATTGATRYLNRNHLFFQNWLHTLLSYNLGFAGTQEYLDSRYLNYEPVKVKAMTIDGNTHWYIRRFLAHKLVFEKPLNNYIATSTRLGHYTHHTKGTLQDIARKKRVSLTLLRKYNQWLKTWKIPNDKAYTVILPFKN